MVSTSKKISKVGAPLRLTPATHKAIVEFVRQGNWIYTAAKALGLSRRTVATWMQVGRGEHPTRPSEEPYTSFALEVEAAHAEAEITIVEEIRNDKDWRAKAWLLERGPARERWSQEITISAQLAPAASILDTLRNRSLTESKEELEPLEVEVKEISNAEGGT